MLSLLLLLSLLCCGVFADDTTKQCTIKLEEVVYHPKSCAFDYFQRISDELRLEGDKLWTPEVIPILGNFMQKYTVDALIVDAFSHVMIYPTYGYLLNTDIARAYCIQRLNTVNGALIAENQAYVFATKFWNSNGQMFYLIVAAEMQNFLTIC